MIFRSNRIATIDFQALHPEQMKCESDAYYAQLARRIYKDLVGFKEVLPSCIREISLKCAAYFEDIISKLGLFAGMRKMHQQMFGKKLPFLTLDKEYLDDEVNVEDLQFLIWSIIQEAENERGGDRFHNAENPGILMMSLAVIAIFEQEYESAPENEHLYYCLHEHQYDDFFMLRDMLSWLHYNSYLSMNYQKKVLNEAAREAKKLPRKELPMPIDMLLYTYNVKNIFTTTTSPLAIKAADWWRNITENKDTVNTLKALQYREMESYQIQHWGENFIKISPVSNDKQLLYLAPDSIRNEAEAAGQKFLTAALVKFRDMWQINGVASFSQDVDELIQRAQAEQKKDEQLKSSNFFIAEKILKYTKNKPLLFFEDFDEWKAFWMKVFTDIPNANEVFANNSLQDSGNLITYVHKKTGVIFIPDLAPLIKAPYNKLYNADLAKNHALALLCGKVRAPLEFFEYVINNKLIPDAYTNSLDGEEHGRKLVQENLWFIVRFFLPMLFNDK